MPSGGIPTKIETEILDYTAEEFCEDSDLMDALDSYARGLLSKQELSDRCEAYLQFAKTRAENKVLGPCEPDDPYARPGTWGAA